MNVDYIESTESTVTQDAVDSCSTKVVPAGSVVIATRVGLGKVCILAKDACFNQDIKAIIPKNGMKIDHKFLFYWFCSISHVIIGAGTGATVQGVRIPFVKQLPFPILPLEEQQRIVSILDEAFNRLAISGDQLNQKILNASEIYQTSLSSIFAENRNWESGCLGDVTGGVQTGPFGSLLHKSDYIANGIPIVNPAHISETGIMPDEHKTISV